MFKKFILITIIILIILLSTINLYSQSLSISIAVLPFNNETENPNYDYIRNSLQESISTSLRTIKDISVIDNITVNEVNAELEVDYENVSNLAKSLRFAVETGTNVLIVGTYDVINYDYKFKTAVYSVAQKKVIDRTEITGKNEFDLINSFSKNISDKLIENKESIEIALDDIAKDIEPPVLISQPAIKEINTEGIIIDWETNKETVSNLYLSESKNFDITENTLHFEDLSDDALYHWVRIDYDTIDPKKSYYFKTSEQDFFDNHIESKEQIIQEDEIYNHLNELYEEKVLPIYKRIDILIIDKAFNTALKEYEKIIELNKKFRKLIDVKQNEQEEKVYKERLQKASECNRLIENANKLLSNGEQEKAKAIYKKVIKLIEDNSLDRFINVKFIKVMVDIIEYNLENENEIQEISNDNNETQENVVEDDVDENIENDNNNESSLDLDIMSDGYTYLGKLYEQAEEAYHNKDFYYALRKYQEIAEVIGETIAVKDMINHLEKVLEVIKLLEEGNLFFEEKLYELAKDRFEKAVKIIEDENIHKLFPMIIINEKLEEARQIVYEENVRPTFINIDFGYSMKAGDILDGENNGWNISIYNAYYLSIHIQTQKYFSLGFGLGLSEESKQITHFNAIMGLYAHKGLFSNFIINVGLAGENFYYEDSINTDNNGDYLMMGPSVSLEYLFKLWVIDLFADAGFNLMIHKFGVSFIPFIHLGIGIVI